MADNGRLDDRLEFLEKAYLEDREHWKQNEERWKESDERWNENQRTISQLREVLVGMGKQIGDHDKMLDRIDQSLGATLKALHRLIEGR